MSEDTLKRMVKEFGNGAHVTVPSDWIGGEVEVTLQVPEKPEVFDGLEQEMEVTVRLENGDEIKGCVEEMSLWEQDGFAYVEYAVKCSFSDKEGCSISWLDGIKDLSMDDIGEFEIVKLRSYGEPWDNTMTVRYFEKEHNEIVAEGDTVRELQFTITRD